MKITTENKISIEYAPKVGEVEVFEEFDYFATPNFSVIGSDGAKLRTKIVLFHDDFKITLRFEDSEKCVAYYNDLLESFKNVGMGGIGDMSDMFGDMFGNIGGADEGEGFNPDGVDPMATPSTATEK